MLARSVHAWLLWGLVLGSVMLASAEEIKPAKLRTYFATSKGIYLGELDLASGALTGVAAAGETGGSSFLVIHPSKKSLYAVGEMEVQGKKIGAVSALAIDAAGKVKLLNQQSSEGAGPCHLSIDKSGGAVLVANYSGGSVASLPIQPDGTLGKAASAIQHQGKSVNPQRQEAPHAHSINFDPANRFAFAADLGLDKVLVYRFDAAKAALASNDPPAVAVAPGAGPRHFAFHPSGKFAYVINEIGNTITGFGYDADKGVLTEIQSITTLPANYAETSYTAEVQVHPSGKFIYGSNRGHNSLAIFKVDQATGKLTVVGHQSTLGKTPRNFGLDPTGTFAIACNQDSDTAVVFRINQETGELKPVGEPVSVPMPFCVKFVAIP